MDKIDIKNFLKQTEEKMTELSGKASEIAKAFGKSTSDLSKEGMLKIEQLTLEHERNKRVSKLGEKTYKLLKSGKIKHASLSDLVKEIKEVENKIRGKKISASKIKTKKNKK